MYETDAGLLLPGNPPPPPLHPAVLAIHARLHELVEDLKAFEQTTHGRLGGDTIGEVGRELAECVLKPNAYTISNLSQSIRAYLRKADECRSS